MADNNAQKAPGKLKFNPAMFNPGALRPGAKNEKLEAMKQKREKEREEKGDEVPSTESEFMRPSRPKRRTKSKKNLPLEDEEEVKQDNVSPDRASFYNQSFIQPVTSDDAASADETAAPTSTTQESQPQPESAAEEATAETDEKSGMSEKLNSALKERKNPPGYTDPSKVSPAIQDSVKKLEHQKKADGIKNKLNSRQDLDYVIDSGFMASDPRRVSSAIAASHSALEQELSNRADKQYLEKTQILKHPNIDPSIQPQADELAKSLEKRPLDAAAKPNSKVAPKLAATSKQLDKQLKSDSLSKGLQQRPAESSMVDSRVAPTLAATSKQLDKQLKTDNLSKGLQQRPPESPLVDAKVAPTLAATAKQLDKQLKTDTLSKGLQQRASMVGSAMVDSRVAPTLAATSKQLDKQLKTDSLSKQLGDKARLGQKALQDKGILKYDNLSGNLVDTAAKLEAQQKEDKLKGNLESRPDLEALHKQNIITPNVAPQFAAHQRALENARKTDGLKQKLNDENRPDRQALEEQGLLYSQSMAASLQPNAMELEPKIREIQNGRDEDNTSSPSNEQSPTQTDIEQEQDQDHDEDGKLSQTQKKLARRRISKSLNQRLSLRRSPLELEQRGILPPNYFDDPSTAYEMRGIERKLHREDLKRKIMDKPPPQELVARGLAQDGFWEKSSTELRSDHRQSIKDARKALSYKLDKTRRPSITELSEKQIVPEDNEVIAELKSIAKAHTRMQSAVQDLSDRLPFEEQTNVQVASTMMTHINATEDDIDLLFSSSNEEEEEEDADAPYRRQKEEASEEEYEDMDADEEQELGQQPQQPQQPTFDLDQVQKKNHKRKLSRNLDDFLKIRPSPNDLEKDGLLKQTAVADSLRRAAVALEARLNDQRPKKELLRKQIIKRPSISRSLQPNAEALESALLDNLAKVRAKDMDLQPVEQAEHPLFKRAAVKKSLHQRKASSGFGTKKNQNPDFYKHDIAPKLQSAANTLHKRRISQKIAHALEARPSKQDLMDSRILYKDNLANQLQANAVSLEEQIKRRVPEDYLQRIGVLIHDKEKVAPALQSKSYELEYALRRRPSLFDGGNQDIVKILGIPSNHDDPNQFYTDNLHKSQQSFNSQGSTPKSYDPSLAFDEMYPDDTDKKNYRLRKQRNGSKLEKRIRNRQSVDDLEKAGLIPKDYFSDPFAAVEMKNIHRKLHAEDLKIGLKNRSTQQELIARGLTRAEYLDMDMSAAKQAIQSHSTNTRKEMELQFNSIFNPELQELEKNGVVEAGYFLTRAKQIEEGHRRLPSVTAELQQKLLNNPHYNEQLASTLVGDLRSDQEEEEEEHEEDSDEDDDDDDEDEDEDDEDDDEYLDSDDEEQARRLQELEYKIGHRPSTEELIEKRILYKKASDMAPAIQNAAKNLQHVITKRPSIQDLRGQGVLLASNQDELDTSSVIKKEAKKNKKAKKRAKPTEKHKDQRATLRQKLNRTRRPTMIDLEKKGIVPRGYFDDVEQAMSEKKIRKENIVNDLATRLADRPDFSGKLASKLMTKALDSLKNSSQMVESGKNEEDKHVIAGILNAKLSERVEYSQLKDKNILSQHYEPELAQRLVANQDALEKAQLQSKLKSHFNARPDEEELYDSGLLKFTSHGEHGLSTTFQPVAVELEDKIKTRVSKKYLKQQGIIDPKGSEKKKMAQQLDRKMGSRPSIGTLEQTGLVPHGAFEDLQEAVVAKHAHQQSVRDELDSFFESDRLKKKDELGRKGVLQEGKKRRGSVEMVESDEEEEANEQTTQAEDVKAESPTIPPVPERQSSMFQTNTYTEIVMNSITFHNQKVTEPSFEIDVLVEEPDLTEDVIQTSTLSFLNVLDNLNEVIASKINRVKQHFIAEMKAKTSDLQLLKHLYTNLEQYRNVSILEEPEFDGVQFSSCGDLDQDLANLMREINAQQMQLFALDSEYAPLQSEIKRLRAVKYDVEQYCDRFKIQLSQLKRVQQQIASYIEENEMIKDSSNEAVKATDEQQAWMIAKITNKIVTTQNKIDGIRNQSPQTQELADELVTCTNFLNGLKEFLSGLKKLRKSSNDKIKHLEVIIEQLKAQQTDILANIKQLRLEAVLKLNVIRSTCLKPQSRAQQSSAMPSSQSDVRNGGNNHGGDNEEDDISDLSSINNDGDDDDDEDDEDDLDHSAYMDFSKHAPLSMLELMHKREKYMSKVYKKIHDLESRAMTTSSSDYLRGLTEIRELQIILNNSKLKHFYNNFVATCNQVFNDCCLANQAILENTAEISTPLLADLRGVQLLNDVLTKNHRKLQRESTVDYLETVVNFVQSLPDREVVIMQIARHLSLALPFRSFITGKEQITLEQNDKTDINGAEDDDGGPVHIQAKPRSHGTQIDQFINIKIREWIGSILNVYGNNTFSSVRLALENDVVAQVRPSYAARLIVNCVYGLDVSL
eukprot:CAMPEP_0202695738 /NCGR_PEP_ID=MMETSP1385-20130828/9258_1 /ASSEMBLY_ACC=CAM_ASM_000861 /TAXON_ID=933848 /ORGANISM="Elphidium margaritaceum" /LENGTH=2423 /DNA_ID=CAMNT_0049351815 /DNA_START=30 /DNA_END=7301 /DNA_ORIENTATION=-